MKAMLLVAGGLYLVGSGKRAVFIVALIVETVYLALRGSELGRLPLIGPHDTLVFFSTSIGVLALPFIYSRSRKGTDLSWGIGIVAGLFTLLALIFPSFVMPLPPVLKTFWFELHVAFAFFAYALFAIAAILGGQFLFKEERPLLDMQYRAVLVGYSFFSASMVAGGIWGYYAWGTYWLWTPKELWTSILWLFYTLYLHLRLKGPSWERLVAWGGIVGFAVTLFTYLGVSMLMKSSHSF